MHRYAVLEAPSALGHIPEHLGVEAHRQFHCITTEGAGPHLQNSITSLSETSVRFVRLAQLGHQASWTRWDADHEAMVEAFRARDHDGAVRTIAQHLARTAFTAMADIAPHLDATMTRAALNLILSTTSA